jgi:hypothetical protein
MNLKGFWTLLVYVRAFPGNSPFLPVATSHVPVIGHKHYHVKMLTRTIWRKIQILALQVLTNLRRCESCGLQIIFCMT